MAKRAKPEELREVEARLSQGESVGKAAKSIVLKLSDADSHH